MLAARAIIPAPGLAVSGYSMHPFRSVRRGQSAGCAIALALLLAFPTDAGAQNSPFGSPLQQGLAAGSGVSPGVGGMGYGAAGADTGGLTGNGAFGADPSFGLGGDSYYGSSPYGATGAGGYGAGSYGGNIMRSGGGGGFGGPTVIQGARQFNPYDYQSLNPGSPSWVRIKPKLPEPSEFELYVERRVGKRLARFGADLITPEARDFAVPTTTSTPPDYRLNPGDEFTINIVGSAQGSFTVVVDPDGRIFIPQVGPVAVANVRYSDLQAVVSRAIAKQFRSYRVTVAMTKLQGVRVYVTGFANVPGAYTLSSLSTVVNAMFAAGGPSAGGSFRGIQLFRAGKLVSDFDLYDLIRKGDKSRDVTVKNEDVLYIPPVGAQVAFVGSVNAEAIYEAKPGESVLDVLAAAGGFNPLADSARLVVYSQRNLDTIGGEQITTAEARSLKAQSGDIVQVLSNGNLARPLERQAVLVRLEGEVSRPGNYYVSPGTTLGQVLQLAGGLTQHAFLYGTQFDRFSVRDQQREAYKAAIDQLELSVAAAPLSQAPTTDTTARASELTAAQSILAKLRLAQPSGRLVLNLPVTAAALPNDMVLENNDHILIPPRPITVGVFGAVYRPGSFEYADGRKAGVYLDRAGGAQRAGDKGDIFVVHANGDVAPRRRGALSAPALPGDIIFVPVKTQSTSILARLRDIGTILFGFGLSAASIVALTQ